MSDEDWGTEPFVTLDFKTATETLPEGYWRVTANEVEVKRNKADDGWNLVARLKILDAANEAYEGRLLTTAYVSLKPEAAWASKGILAVMSGQDLDRDGFQIDRDFVKSIEGRSFLVVSTHQEYDDGTSTRTVSQVDQYLPEGAVDGTTEGANFYG